MPQRISLMSKITILYGTETGNSEYLSDLLSQAFDDHSLDNQIFDLGEYEGEQIKDENTIVIITSTYGNGEPPSNAQAFYEYLEELLKQGQTTVLQKIRFAVCGLGDRTFQNFANAGKMFDAILENLGAQRMIDRVDCDDDYEDQFEFFQDKIVEYLTKN